MEMYSIGSIQSVHCGPTVGGYVILVGLQELVDDGLRMLKGTFQEHCSKQVTLSTVYFVTQSTWETRRFLPLPHFTAISLVR